MAVKSGFSHSLATLLLTLISALLIHFLRYVGFFDEFFDGLLNYSDVFSQWLEKNVNIAIPHEIFPTILVAAGLAFIWGIVFHLARR